MKYLFFAVLLVNLLGFFTMWRDKRLSTTQGARRVPERTLFLIALCGGSIGSWMGMKLFRHKTKHWRFSIGLPLIFFLQVGAIIYFMY